MILTPFSLHKLRGHRHAKLQNVVWHIFFEFALFDSTWCSLQQDGNLRRLKTMSVYIIVQVACMYFQTFLKTMLAEWFRIDKLRLDKFMMLIRCFFNQAFSRLALRQWCVP
jgi:hypothetical protein